MNLQQLMRVCTNRFVNRPTMESRHLELGSLERLEDRRLLAGNVTATLTGSGDLRVTGDSSGNDVHIFSMTPGKIAVVGMNGTGVNDGGYAEFDMAAGTVEDDVVINMRGGNDTVLVGQLAQNVNINDQLSINLGAGDDSVAVYHVTAEDLRVIGGGGTDLMTVVGSSIIDTFLLNGGGQDDSIYVDCSFASNNARITTGGGNDGIFFASSATKLTVQTGGGNDFVALGNTLLGVTTGKFVLGGGDDVLAVSDQADVDSASVIGGGGSDSLLVTSAATFNTSGTLGGVELANFSAPEANGLAIASVLAYQNEWTNGRGLSSAVFLC